MSKKRFTYDEFEDCIIDNLTGKTYWGLDDILSNKLNEFHEENEQLKDENERLKRLTAHYEIVDINELAAIIAKCKGITVEECFEEMREEYTKGGEKDD